MRLAEEQVAAIRTTDAAWVTRNDSYGNTWRVVDLLDTLDAAEARAEAAEAKLDEQIEAAIALRHDLDTLRDLYGAAEARITAALIELDRPIGGPTVLRDRILATRAALVEPVGEPPRPLEHTPFAMPDGAERCAADGLPWPCPEVVGEPPRPEENMDQDESNEHARPDRAEIPPEPMSDGERLAYMGTDAARWADQFLGVLAWSPDGLTPSVDFGLMVGWFANAIEAGRNASAVGDPQPPTCAECQDERWVCDRFGHGLCRDPRCVVNRRPCPSCAPTESDPT